MWQLAHLASGALVGQQASVPVIAFGLGVGAHFLIDKIPHYWPWPISERHWFTAVDYLITIPVFYFSLKYFQTNQIGIIWGALGSLSVDALLVGVPWLHHSKLGKWHHDRQPHHRKPIYLITDAVVIVLSLLFLAK